MEKISIARIYQEYQIISQFEKIKVQGWVKSIRQSKFIELNDGSCLLNLQIICPAELTTKLKGISFGSSLVVVGKLILTPERKQICELQATKIEFINLNNLSYSEPPQLPWISSEALTELYFLTDYTPPTKLVSEKAKVECQLPVTQAQTVLVSALDLSPAKIAWVSPYSQFQHLLGTQIWQLLGTKTTLTDTEQANLKWVSKNATLFFTLRSLDLSSHSIGSMFPSIQASAFMDMKINWVFNPVYQKYFLTLLNTPLVKIKDLHRKIKDLLLLKYFLT